MSELLIISTATAYILGLFAIAYYSEHFLSRWSNQGLVYALSLMVYCTAWTFYGSVGKAATDGIEFLAIYIGPLITIPLWWFLLRKMVVATRTLRISSIADFISVRYGKDRQLGTLVAMACFFGVIPYIALQLKAISGSIEIMSGEMLFDPSIFIAVLLTVFAILFGARNVDANQRKPGLITAIAFESVIKLLAFLVVGAFVVYGVFNGFGDLFTQARSKLDLSSLTMFRMEGGFADWFLICLVSGIAFLLLPRQFQVSSVDAGSEEHILSAMKITPVYLLLINLFVIPIALAGLLITPGSDPDFFVLSLPLNSGQVGLALLVFLGGFSAASGMILVSTTALSTMLSNYVFIPLLLNTQKDASFEKPDYQRKLLFWRRVTIVIIMLLAFSYFKLLTSTESLVGIGLISFIAIAQLAPAFFGGLYWKKANKQAAFVGISSGLVIWFLFLVWPHIIMQLGLDSIGFGDFIVGQMGISSTAATILISLTVNTSCYIYLTLAGEQNAQEVNQAELFVGIFKYANSYDSSVAWRGVAYFPDIKSLFNQFIGKERTETVLNRYAQRHGIDWEANPRVDSRVISYAERVLTGIIGPSSARIMVSNVVEEEEISVGDVLDILHESKEVLKLNKELQQKSQQLARATQNLTDANEKLKKYGELKDEFLYTVTHELRTPVTAIRSMAEIMDDVKDMSQEERDEFMTGIINESERMTKLISNVLDLEKFESGSQQLDLTSVDLGDLIQQEVKAIEPLTKDKEVKLSIDVSESLAQINADSDRIRQVLTNLLSNAVKYCDQKKGIIELEAINSGDEVVVEIRNNGSAISEADLENVFDKFYQVRNQTRKKPTGHGLGLAICQNIIAAHDGKIQVNLEGGMVKFSFNLPMYLKEKA